MVRIQRSSCAYSAESLESLSFCQVSVEAEDTLYTGLALGKLLDSADTERGQARLACSRLSTQPGSVLLFCSEVPLALSAASCSCPRAFALPVLPALNIFTSCRAIPMSKGPGLAALTRSKIAVA